MKCGVHEHNLRYIVSTWIVRQVVLDVRQIQLNNPNDLENVFAPQ